MNIWNDPWVPETSYGRITWERIDVRYTTVADLIDREHNTWKEDTVQEIVDVEQANAILAIPIAQLKLLDRKI